jgi:hypothetical protein
MYKTTGILSQDEFEARREQGDFAADTTFEEYLAMVQAQREHAAGVRAAMNPLDREILEYHEARRRRGKSKLAA